MTDDKVMELLNDMSLDEKIGQMVQLTGNFYSDDGLNTGPMQAMELTEEQVNNAGSVLSVVGAKKIKKMQQSYMEHQPHHIPMVFMADVINGYRTVFPIPLAQGCSFQPELSKKMAAVAAKESARAGLHAVFSPMVDLVRDARWGRVMESTGEDVYLNACYAGAMVEGYQGTTIGEKDKVSSCIKHFAGYGAPLGGRDYNQVELSERTLFEDYLPAYQAGVDAGSRMVMTSFNTLGRVPVTGNEKLMRGVLREQWGFDGILISDWAAVLELLNHSVAESKEDAAFQGMRAGVDIDMVTNVYSNHLKKLVESGKVPMEWIDEAVLRILRFKNELGLFENPYKDADEIYDESMAPDAEHLAFAREALPETFVLLKNEDEILPLSIKSRDHVSEKTSDMPREKTVSEELSEEELKVLSENRPEQLTEELNEKISETEKEFDFAFIGPFIDEKQVCGCWTLFHKPEETVTISEALKERKNAGRYCISKGCSILSPGQKLMGFTEGLLKNTVTAADLEEMKQEALEKAAKSECVILTLGEHRYMSGEGASRTEITIPEHQMELFREIHKVNPNIIAVIFSGRPLDLREITDKAKAILQVWFPGTESGHAITDVLYGDASPGGRLSMSFPYNVGQVPVYYSELATGRKCEDPNNRFCSRYIDAPNKPLYVFGYGLDYTKYAYDNIKLSADTLSKGRSLQVSVDVSNIGSRAGKEVVQLYVQDVCGSVARPVRQLKAFEKIALDAGETKTVTFEITPDMLKFYDVNMDYTVEPGEFKVYVGGDSNADLTGSFVYI